MLLALFLLVDLAPALFLAPVPNLAPALRQEAAP